MNNNTFIKTAEPLLQFACDKVEAGEPFAVHVVLEQSASAVQEFVDALVADLNTIGSESLDYRVVKTAIPDLSAEGDLTATTYHFQDGDGWVQLVLHAAVMIEDGYCALHLAHFAGCSSMFN